MIKTVELSKTYNNGLQAVKSMNFEVKEGDIFGFLGPNGAGKTTTIRMLTGLMTPTSGEAYMNGVNVKRQSKVIKSTIGVLPESHGYYNWMTAYEYLQYFYRLFKQSPQEESVRLNNLLKKVGLDSRSHNLIGEYSRGMKQRLGIAKTLVNNPKIIFLDEPTLGLDPSGQKDIHDIILDLNKSFNVTVFITSHLLKDIEVLCNKVAIVKNGNLLVCDTIVNLQKEHAAYDIIHIKTSANEKALNLLKVVNGYEVLKIEEDTIIMTTLKSVNLDKVKKQILEILFLSKIDILELKQVNITIEDLFLKVISNSEQGGNE